jgi:ABC-2 type transport system permease protein
MTLASLYVSALLATMKRDAAIFLTYRLRFVTQTLGMLFSLATFYYVAKLVRPDAVGGRGHYYAFVVVGIVITSVLTAAISMAQVVRLELVQGSFERLLVSPLGALGLVALGAFPISYALVFAGLMLTLAHAIFGVPLHAAGIPPALVVAALGALAFGSIGLLFVAVLLVTKSPAGANWVVAGLSLLGGAYFPIRLFPSWIRWMSEVQPFTPAVDLLRHLLVGTPSAQPVWLELLRLGGFTAVLMPAALVAVVLATSWSRRRGTIMEY